MIKFHLRQVPFIESKNAESILKQQIQYALLLGLLVETKNLIPALDTQKPIGKRKSARKPVNLNFSCPPLVSPLLATVSHNGLKWVS